MATAYSSKRLEWAKVAAIPIALALVGWIVTSSQTTAEQQAIDARAAAERAASATRTANSLDAQYVGLALEILRTPVDADSSQREIEIELRRWAVDLLAASSPVEVPARLRELLSEGDLTLPTNSCAEIGRATDLLVAEDAILRAVLPPDSFGPAEMALTKQFEALELRSEELRC